MSKQEFLDKLREALNGSLGPSTVAEHIRFYEEYISSEMQKGKSEEWVMSSLGDPRLIARTIIQTNTTEDDNADLYRTVQREEEQIVKRTSVPGWVWILIVILILVLVLSVVMSVLSFLAPFLIPIVVVAFLVKLFRDWLK